jgi:hypothetical protein
MIEAFSTSCSSAKPSNSVGDLSFKSCNFISRIGMTSLENGADSFRADAGRLWRSQILNEQVG